MSVCIGACGGDGSGGGSGKDDGGSSGSGSNGASNGDSNGESGGNGSGDDGGEKPVGPLNPLDPATIRPDPNAVIIPNLDSAIINIKAVDGAKDYRAFAMEDGVEILTDSDDREVVNGATIFCAGQRQVSGPAPTVPEVMRQIEVTDLKKKTVYVVEAVDRLCPFTGLFGREDTQFVYSSPDNVTPMELKTTPIPVLSEASIRKKYGSFIVNGHGGASLPGQPAENVPPKVLKRWTVEVAPLSAEEAQKRKTSDFFADFAIDDPPQPVAGLSPDVFPDGTYYAPYGYGHALKAYQNKDFIFYGTNTDFLGGKNQIFYDRGQLHMVLADASQDTMGATVAIPRKVTHVNDDTYLHVTFESSTNSTERRYWWLSVCGAETPGQTIDTATGMLTNWMILLSGFFGRDGTNPSVAGWNCLIVFPHDGIQAALPADSGSNPQSSVIVLIHKANTPGLQSAVNVSPQEFSDGYPRAWYRVRKGGKATTKGILDDYLQEAPRVRFDMYISRSQLVMYVNGEQRICNNFGPEKLTMAEATVGFNNALYHSSAERNELTVDFHDRSGQFYYLQNAVFADPHTFDNVGFEEGVNLPGSFSGAECYTHTP